MVSIGQKAPAFTLVNTENKEVSLSDYSGKKVVLLFFPFAYTGVCTTELCTVRDSISSYEGLDAQILAISVDSPFTLAKFKEDHKLNFPLLSDFNKTASQAYGAFYDEFVFGLKGVSKRAAFVIDPEGTVKHVEVLENAGDLPSFEAINNALTN